MLFGLIPWGAKPERKTWSGDHIRVGDTVVSFEAHGCMAEQHVFQWVGVVESFHNVGSFHGSKWKRQWYAEVRPVKFEEHHTDERDVKYHAYHCYLDDPALQRLPSGIWLYVK